jgi:hypothetical protein
VVGGEQRALRVGHLLEGHDVGVALIPRPLIGAVLPRRVDAVGQVELAEAIERADLAADPDHVAALEGAGGARDLLVVVGVGRAPRERPPQVAQRQLEPAIADQDMAAVAAHVVDHRQVAAPGRERTRAVELALALEEGVLGRPVDVPHRSAPALALVLLAGAVVDVVVGAGLEGRLGRGLDSQAGQLDPGRLIGAGPVAVARVLEQRGADVVGVVRQAIGEDAVVGRELERLGLGGVGGGGVELAPPHHLIEHGVAALDRALGRHQRRERRRRLGQPAMSAISARVSSSRRLPK